VSPQELREAQRASEDARLLAHLADQRRNAAVREALREGWTHARIAEATGLTRGRVGQIAKP
jgi:hypothetical protein